MGTLVQFGTVVQGSQLERVSVQAGYTAYVIPLDDRLLTKQLGYVKGFGYIEMTQEESIQSRIAAYPAYFMLVARIDTDMNRQQVSDNVSVGYIRFTTKSYQAFILARQANPGACVIMLSGIQGRNGVTINYLPTVFSVSPAVQQKVELLCAKPDTRDALFAELDTATGRPYSKYQEWLSASAGVGGGVGGYGGVQAPVPPMSSYGGTAAGQGYGVTGAPGAAMGTPGQTVSPGYVPGVPGTTAGGGSVTSGYVPGVPGTTASSYGLGASVGNVSGGVVPGVGAAGGVPGVYGGSYGSGEADPFDAGGFDASFGDDSL